MVFQDLSPELLQKVKDTFKVFDVDGSKSIDKEEAIKHWKSKFGKLSAKEFFDQVDVNNDGEISEAEFIEFWKIVKGAKHTEEEIDEELMNIQNGETWTGFSNLPSKDQLKAISKND